MLASIVKIVLDYLLGKLAGFIREAVAFFQRKKAIEDAAGESKKPLDQAKTEKEIDDAAKDVLNNL